MNEEHSIQILGEFDVLLAANGIKVSSEDRESMGAAFKQDVPAVVRGLPAALTRRPRFSVPPDARPPRRVVRDGECLLPCGGSHSSRQPATRAVMPDVRRCVEEMRMPIGRKTRT